MGLEAIQSAIGSMKDFSVEVINTVTPISRCFATQKECIHGETVWSKDTLLEQDQSKVSLSIQ